MKPEKEWFRDWFNSPYYLSVYSHRDFADAILFFNLIKKTIPLSKDYKILDFCCGNGRLSIVLMENGFSVKGIDLSEYLISLAIEDAKNKSLKYDFEVCDARNFNPMAEYDLVINFFTSFGYLSDDENEIVFQNMSKAIKPNGYLIFDFLNRDSVMNNLVPFDEALSDKFLITQERMIESNRILKNIRIKFEQNEEVFTESVRLYSKKEIEELFAKNNIGVINTFGDYEGNPYSSESPRLILIGQKNK